jgi:CheY-like chemotaxis protein
MSGEGLMKITASNLTLAANEVGDVRAGEYVRIAVTDTGCGMTPEVMERAFEPFFTTKPVGKGTGLGLSQIFGFAHQSGGEVGIESQSGKGTTVSIYLPRTVAAEAPVRLHPVQRADNEATVPGARILVVEDDPRVRASTIEALQDLDYDPIACGSGAEAIVIFESQPFDLVISDVIMPEMTGPELIKHLKQTHDDFAVLFVTGYVGDGETGDLVGYELLRKPFTVGALANAVAVALTRRPNEPRRSGGAAAAG